MPYGMELILDLHDCDPTTFNRDNIDKYFEVLCQVIGMERCERHFWDDVGVPEEEKQTEPHTKGTTAVLYAAEKPVVATQFILTSNITVHCLELLKAVYINIFSCKRFDPDEAVTFSGNYFKAESWNKTLLDRI